VYAIYGFAPGDVLPTTELILSHQHPEDRPEVERLIDEVIATGRPHSLWHRLVDAQGTTRQVLTLWTGDFDDDGDLVGVSGFLVDLTETVRRTTAREVDEAMEVMSHSRPPIEQAKGALMLAYGLSDDDAFALLRSYSQHVNVKVRDVARNVVDALPERDLPIGTRETWDRLAAELVGPAGERVDPEKQPGA
jgi:PAS domain-containing protein